MEDETTTQDNTAVQHMTGATMSMTEGANPYRQNPIVAAVESIRALQDDLTSRQITVRDAGRRRVDALIASGNYSLIAQHRQALPRCDGSVHCTALPVCT